MGCQNMEKGGNITRLAKNSGCFRKRLSEKGKNKVNNLLENPIYNMKNQICGHGSR